MLAAVAREIPTERLEISTVAAPSPEAPDDVIVRVEACGVCGTDLHILGGESYRPKTPFVLGHEPVGVVVGAGDGAREWLGRRVTMTLFTGDGSCPMCTSGARIHQHLDIGRGELDWAELRGALQSVGFDGILTVQVFGWDERAEQSFQLNRAALERLFGAANGLGQR